jgi:hypothetical protein
LGRFTSPDNVQPNAPGTQGYNLYSYVAGRPVDKTDPSGHGILDSAIQWATQHPYAAAALAVLGVALYQVLLNLVRQMECPVQTPHQRSCPELTGDFAQRAEDVVNELEKRLKPRPAPCQVSCDPAPVLPSPSPRQTCASTSKQPYPADRINGLPVFCVYEARTKNIYQNDVNGQRNGKPGNPTSNMPLHYAGQTEADQNRREARAAAGAQGLNCPAVGLQLDEYPFAGTWEGGLYEGKPPQLMCVPGIENQTQGGDYGAFTRLELFNENNARFWVLPVP